MKKNLLSGLLFFLFIFPLLAQDKGNFYDHFNDSTLRIDYIFGGGPQGNHIFLNAQTKQKGWAGRRHNLKKTPVSGNGNILITNPISGDTLYNNCFSTLFQEWITTPEASQNSLGFENSFLVPLPKEEAEITISLKNNRGEEIAKHSHRYRPNDELVKISNGSKLNYKYLHQAPAPNRAIDLAILAEGYTTDQMEAFLSTASSISNEILSYEPFASNKDYFNIVAVFSPSEESGTSIPLNQVWKNTRYGSHFSTFYSDRYLTAPKVWKMHQDLEGIPYEYVLILVNTSKYGGGGIFNNYQIASANNEFTLPVSVHEFGHSFAGLADEYDYGDNEDETYPGDIEPWEQNITTLVDFGSKWETSIDKDIPIPTPWENKSVLENRNLKPEDLKLGVYEGAGYRKNGIFRPTVTCRMRDNYFPTFCPVCKMAIQEIIDFYTDR